MNGFRERIIHTSRLIGGRVLDLFFPQKCVSCSKPGETLCAACRSALFRPGGQCLVCGFRNNDGKICREHRLGKLKILWAGRYDGALKDAVWNLKYKNRKALAEPLAKMLFQKFSEMFPTALPSQGGDFKNENFIIVPVPLHKNKLRRRGFNQAELLARGFSKLSNIQLLTGSLLKIKETPAQVDVQNRETRLKNLDGAFSADSEKLTAYGVGHKAIILIDDVSTTGATLIHASAALQRAGAQKIIGLVAAHGG
ncbi:MAG: ComF family protein [Candidatus Giovannonibacteria bacterium]|nr:MAG: ComF family protein [Candidatus Giovannonibacteria bacterium]